MSNKKKTIDSFRDWYYHATPQTECKILSHIYNKNVDYLLSSKNSGTNRERLENGLPILDDNMPSSTAYQFDILRRGLSSLAGNEKKAFYQKYFGVGCDQPIDQRSLQLAERHFARYVDGQLGSAIYFVPYFQEKTKDRVKCQKGKYI